MWDLLRKYFRYVFRPRSRAPVKVILRGADGEILTHENLREVTGKVSYEIVGEHDVPNEAIALHRKGREAGAGDDYERALALFENASQMAPKWPYPVYDIAFTYLLMHDYDTALKYYRRTLELSPRGFFTAITAVDTLEREEIGELPVGTYLEYVSLEWEDDPAEKAEALRALVAGLPDFAPGWAKLASIADGSPEEELKIIEKGLAAHPDAETKGTLQINKALTLNRKGNRKEAIGLLEELALDPNSTCSTELLAKSSLANLLMR